MLKKMRVALIQYVTYLLNNIPKDDQDNSPREMVLGAKTMDFKSLCQIPFGAYVQVHDDNQITNTMEPRTVVSINLGPTGNIQGGHKFFSLTTGEIMLRRKWTELPVLSEVMLRLQELSNDPINNVSEEVESEEEERNEDDKENKEEYEDMPELTELEEDEEIVTQIMEQEIEDAPVVSEADETMIMSNISEDSEETKENEEQEEEKNEHGDNLHPKHQPNYDYRFSFLSVKSAVKKWGSKAIQAMREEMQMLLNENVFKMISKPTNEQKLKALRIHGFIVEKRDGRVKGRAVADGRTQIQYKEE
jgi:hypothetical protein